MPRKQQAKKSRFQIDKLEERIAPALLSIMPSAVGGVAEGPAPCLHPVPDQAAQGLQAAAESTPDDLLVVTSQQGEAQVTQS